MSKHIINNKNDWAKESLQGFLIMNSSRLFALKEFPNVVIRKDYLTLEETNSRVALISGGGSGHEPAHLGFIGKGMLTGVVCGDLFASPSIASILAAIRFVGRSNKAGVLLIVKNYTGDRLNFGLASKRAQLEGINVEWVLVDDDVALIENENQRDNTVGKRGLCGTIMIHKIAGAMAEQRKSLKEIKETVDYILKKSYLRTLGVSLSGRVKLPGEANNSNSNTNDDNLIEVGLGIHGEAGRTKVELKESNLLVKFALDDYLLKNVENLPKDVCILVNNLGGLSYLETYLLVNDIFKYFEKLRPDYNVRRIFSGTFMTSLNMNGFSITVLHLDENNSSFVLNLLDSHTDSPSWPKKIEYDPKKIEYVECYDKDASAFYDFDLEKNNFLKFSDPDASKNAKIFKSILITICNDLINIEDYLNKLDSECGDGDCGSSLSRVSRNVLNEIERNDLYNFEYPHQVILQISRVFENGGGSLCILLALFTSAGAQAFSLNTTKRIEQNNKQLLWLKIWLNFVELGIEAVEEYGRAKPKQRSIIDPLTDLKNFIKEYTDSLKSTDEVKLDEFFKKLVDVTYQSAMSTEFMKPRVGRASYIDASLIKSPDAGSMGISSIVTSIYKAYLLNL